MAEPGTDYPAQWEADVVLRDGGTAHLRPIRPDDAERLQQFQSRLSDETIYFRFFSLYRELSAKDVERFTVVDHHDRAALVATIGEDLIGVVRCERLDASPAPKSPSTSRTGTRGAAWARSSSSTSRPPRLPSRERRRHLMPTSGSAQPTPR